MDLERPHVSIIVKEPGLRWTINGKPVALGLRQLEYSVVNYGKTPAFLLVLFAKLEVGKDLPPYVDLSKQPGRNLPYGVIAGSDKPYDFRADWPSEADMKEVGPKGKDIFLVGYLKYSDISDNHYMIGFCQMLDCASHCFVPVGDERYNYVRQVQKSVADVPGIDSNPQQVSAANQFALDAEGHIDPHAPRPEADGTIPVKPAPQMPGSVRIVSNVTTSPVPTAAHGAAGLLARADGTIVGVAASGALEADGSASVSFQSGAVVRLVKDNNVTIILSITSLVLLIDDKLASLRSKNDPDWDVQITRYENIKKDLEALSGLTFEIKNKDVNIEERTVTNLTTKFADGISDWWEKDHEDICKYNF
jgi:hypothetical protein